MLQINLVTIKHYCSWQRIVFLILMAFIFFDVVAAVVAVITKVSLY